MRLALRGGTVGDHGHLHMNGFVYERAAQAPPAHGRHRRIATLHPHITYITRITGDRRSNLLLVGVAVNSEGAQANTPQNSPLRTVQNSGKFQALAPPSPRPPLREGVTSSDLTVSSPQLPPHAAATEFHTPDAVHSRRPISHHHPYTSE